MNINIRTLRESDLSVFFELMDLFESVFEMTHFERPAIAQLDKLLAQDHFIVMLAEWDGVVIGGLTAYVLEQHYSTRPLAYIYDLAVATEHHRKGIGALLVKTFNAQCRSRGFEEVFVQADRVDDYALDFYRKTQPTAEENVVHFCYTLGSERLQEFPERA